MKTTISYVVAAFLTLFTMSSAWADTNPPNDQAIDATQIYVTNLTRYFATEYGVDIGPSRVVASDCEAKTCLITTATPLTKSKVIYVIQFIFRKNKWKINAVERFILDPDADF